MRIVTKNGLRYLPKYPNGSLVDYKKKLGYYPIVLCPILNEKNYEVIDIERDTDHLTYSKIINYQIRADDGSLVWIAANDVLETLE